MNKLKLCIAIFFTAQGMCVNAMQQQCTITDLPPPVIRRITGFIKARSVKNAFAGACHYLHDSVATENKSLAVNCQGKKGNLSVAEFLDKVFTCVQHIVERQGNNYLAVHLGGNDLGTNMRAVSTFLGKCSQSPIVQFIAIMSLGGNKFTFLPEEIKGLTYLEYLYLDRNALEKKDLILLEKIINESLKRLKVVDIDENMALHYHDIYQTIAHCPLQEISAYHLEGWHDFKPTPEQLQTCKARFVAY